jgi:uncharacterized protein
MKLFKTMTVWLAVLLVAVGITACGGSGSTGGNQHVTVTYMTWETNATNALLDDANAPSLLALPYLGYRASDDALYQQTRRFLLSQENAYYFQGKYACGIGSPHTPARYIWPIALAMQGLTSTDQRERDELLQTLLRTTADTGYMHESFHPDDPAQFTRAWFAWANSLCAEFIASMA